jgi:hypothetical protein
LCKQKRKKAKTLQDLRYENEISCAVITLQTIQEAGHSVACLLGLVADISNIRDIKESNATMD